MSLNIFKIKIPPFKYFRSKEEEENNYIDDLPPELLVRIFSFYVNSEGHRKFLKNIPLVCKRWNDIYETPSIWKNVLETEWKCDEIIHLGERGLLTSVRKIDYFKLTLVLCGQEIEIREPFSGMCVVEPKCSNDFFNVSRISQIINFCPNLRELRLFSNCVSEGLMQTLAEQCPNIEILELYLVLAWLAREPMPEGVLVPFLRVRGQNLKILKLSSIFFCDNDLLSTIAQHCHSLEEFFCGYIELQDRNNITGVPDHYLDRPQLTFNELMTGCPKLRKLTIHCCIDIAFSEVGQDQSGFENIEEFRAAHVDFNGMDLFSILKNARNLKSVKMILCKNFLLNYLSRIPSEKMENLDISCDYLDQSTTIVEIFEETVFKWKHTLISLEIDGLELDVTTILEAYLRGNANPRLKKFDISESDVSIPVLKTLLRTCKKLSKVRWKEGVLRNRLEVEDFCLEPAAPTDYYHHISYTLDRYIFQIIIVLLCILCLGCVLLHSNR